MKKPFLIVGLLLFIAQIAVCQHTKQNKQIVSRYFDEVINHQNIALVSDLYTDELTYYDLHNFTETKSNVKSFQETLAGFFKA